jgi:hypothetical protein
MTGWETLSDAIATDSDQFGGAYLNRITQLLIGADIGVSDPTLAPIIGTKWTFKSGMLWFQDVAGTHTVNLIPDTQSVNVVIKTPAQSFTPDYLVLRTQAETLQNKVLSGTQNTFSNIPDSALSANVDLVNSPGTISGLDTYLTNCLGLRNPANTFTTTLNSGAIVGSNLTLTLPTTADTLIGKATTDVLTNKSISGATNTITLIPDTALSANVDLTNTPGTTSQLETFLTATLGLRNPANTFSTILNAGVVVTANNTLTLPIITDTLVGKTTTDVLSNKSISGATNTLTLIPDAALSSNIDFLNGPATVTALDTFLIGTLGLRNPANTFTALLNNGAAVANTTITLPSITDTLAGLASTQVFTGTNTFNSTLWLNNAVLRFINPAQTFSYILVTSALLANRNITLPLLTADDTFVFANFIQTLENKTIGTSDLTFLDTADMILGPTTGTRIGTATTQKLAFYGKAPIVQTSAIASPTSDTVGTKVAIDAIRTALINLGLTA